jgi:hypothetical protein
MAEIDRNLNLVSSKTQQDVTRPISSQSALFRSIRYNLENEEQNSTESTSRSISFVQNISVWAIWGVLVLIFISRIIYGDRT